MTDSLRDLYLGFVRVYVLYHASHEPAYGKRLSEELAQHGYKLSPGRLHSILHGLEEGKLLSSYEEVINGKVRKYYETTAAGRRVLKAAQTMVGEFMFMQRDPSRMKDIVHFPRARDFERWRKGKHL
jgi:DNA-binding PadR family transcriptional regulator